MNHYLGNLTSGDMNTTDAFQVNSDGVVKAPNYRQEVCFGM